jgi:hypothetical protein
VQKLLQEHERSKHRVARVDATIATPLTILIDSMEEEVI